jgi:metallo-beta-lactamase class B
MIWLQRVLVALLVGCAGSRGPSVQDPAQGAGSRGGQRDDGDHPRPAIHDPVRPIEPFRIVGNLYYVGTLDTSSFLFATPEGLILVDSGEPEMVGGVERSIEKLGFHVRDLKILLAGHAHWDHVGGHAALQRASGAKVMALGEDATALERGTDLSPSSSDGWEPVHVDRVLNDGDTVELGGTKLRAVWAPGHTPGCTVWTSDVMDRDRPYNVAFFACMEPSGDVRLTGNPRFPRLVEDTRETFRKLRRLTPDYALLVHPEEQFAGKLAQLQAGAQPSPLYDPQAWGRFLDESEAELERRVNEERRR